MEITRLEQLRKELAPQLAQSIYDDFRLENAKKGMSMLELKFAFIPTYCRRCDCLILLRFFYGMTSFNRRAYGYGPSNNDHHCRDCHNRMMSREGFCHDCHWAWGKLWKQLN